MTRWLVAFAWCWASAAQAGTYLGVGVGDGAPIREAFTTPWQIATDGTTMLVADAKSQEVRIVRAGRLERLAGTGIRGFSGDGGSAALAQLALPTDVAVTPLGWVIIADAGNSKVRAVEPTMTTISTMVIGGDPEAVAATAEAVYIGNGALGTLLRVTPFPCAANQPPLPICVVETVASGLGNVADVLVAGNGDFYVSDRSLSKVRKISGGVVTVVAGGGTSTADGIPALSARLNQPIGVALAPNGDLYIADMSANKVRRVSNGIITTAAGNGQPQSFLAPIYPADPLQQPMSSPSGVVIMGNNFYVASDLDRAVYGPYPLAAVPPTAAASNTATWTATLTPVPPSRTVTRTNTPVPTNTAPAATMTATATRTLPICLPTATPQGPCVPA